MVNPSTAWVLASLAIAHRLGLKPLPRGVSSAAVGDWHLKINTGPEPADGLNSFDIRCENTKCLAIGMFGPEGGLIGGYSEDLFIEDMKQAVPESVWAEMLA